MVAVVALLPGDRAHSLLLHLHAARQAELQAAAAASAHAGPGSQHSTCAAGPQGACPVGPLPARHKHSQRQGCDARGW